MIKVDIWVYLLDVTSGLEWSLQAIEDMPFSEFTTDNFIPFRHFEGSYNNWDEMKASIKDVVWDNSRNIVEVRPDLKYVADNTEHYERFIKNKSGYLAFVGGQLLDLPIHLKDKLDNLMIDRQYRVMFDEKPEPESDA